MRDIKELNYKIRVEPTIHDVLDQVTRDAGVVGIQPDEVHRAVWSWVAGRINVEDYVNGTE